MIGSSSPCAGASCEPESFCVPSHSPTPWPFLKAFGLLHGGRAAECSNRGASASRRRVRPREGKQLSSGMIVDFRPFCYGFASPHRATSPARGQILYAPSVQPASERARQPQTQPVPRYQTGKHTKHRQRAHHHHTHRRRISGRASLHSGTTATDAQHRHQHTHTQACRPILAAAAAPPLPPPRAPPPPHPPPYHPRGSADVLPAAACLPACLPAAAAACCCCLLLARPPRPRPRDPHESAAMFFFIKLVLGTRPRRIEIDGSSTWSTRVDVGTGAAYCGCTPRTS